MESEQTMEIDNLKEGDNSGVWIIAKSKKHPGHQYYFNTVTGEAVWNLSEQQKSSFKCLMSQCSIENNMEPKDKPPLMNFNVAAAFDNQGMNNTVPISTFVYQQANALQTPIAITPINFTTTQSKFDPNNLWELGVRQQILIVPTLAPSTSQQQSVNIGFDMQQRNMSERGNMFNNRFGDSRLKANRGKNFHNKKRSRFDLRKRIYNSYDKNETNTNEQLSDIEFNNNERLSHGAFFKDEKSNKVWTLDESESIDAAPLKILAKSNMKEDCWFIVVDVNVLLHNFSYLSNLASTDSSCFFLVPQCVQNELQSHASEGKDANARRVLRFLTDSAYIGEENLEDGPDGSSTCDVSNKIYNVCVNIQNDNYHVVLISDDTILLKYKNILTVLTMLEVKTMVSNYILLNKSFTPCISTSNTKINFNKNMNNKTYISEDKSYINDDVENFQNTNEINIDNKCNEPKDKNIIESKVSSHTAVSSVSNKRILKLNRNVTPEKKNETANVCQKRKFRWRKRRTLSTAGSSIKNLSDISNTENTREIENDERHSCINKPNEKTVVTSSSSNSFGMTSSCDRNVETNLNMNSKATIRNKNSLDYVMFEVLNETMEQNLKIKCDEWVSRFFQIMEDVLSQMLRHVSIRESAIPPPWSFLEAVQCTIKEYFDNCYIVDAANKLSIILNKISEKCMTNMQPTIFMEMYSYGVYLIDALKIVNESSEELKNASKSLSDLLHDIQNSHLDSNDNNTLIEEAANSEDESPGYPLMLKSNKAHHEEETGSSTTSPHKYKLRRNSDTSQVSVETTDNIKIKENLTVTHTLSAHKTMDNRTELSNDNLETIIDRDNDVIDGVTQNYNENEDNNTNIEPKIVRCFTKFPQFERRIRASYMSKDLDSDLSCDQDNYEDSGDVTNCDDIDLTPLTVSWMDKVESGGLSQKQEDLFFQVFFSDLNDVFTSAKEFCKNSLLDLKKKGTLPVNYKLKTEKLKSEMIVIRDGLDRIFKRGNEESFKELLEKKRMHFVSSEQYKDVITKFKNQADTLSKTVEYISQSIKR